MKSKPRNYRMAVAVLSTCLCASTALGQNSETELHVLSIGEQRSTVIALLGAPTGSSEALTFGVPNAKLRWVVGSRVYVAWFVANRLISIRVCQSMADC